jgi:hypothetical protein
VVGVVCRAPVAVVVMWILHYCRRRRLVVALVAVVVIVDVILEWQWVLLLPLANWCLALALRDPLLGVGTSWRLSRWWLCLSVDLLAFACFVVLPNGTQEVPNLIGVWIVIGLIAAAVVCVAVWQIIVYVGDDATRVLPHSLIFCVCCP